MFEGKTVFVSGAASGIGRATALLFAQHGARVAAVDIVTDAAEQTVDQIRAAGGHATALTCDVRNHDAVAEAVARTIAWGGGLHHAFNNAGVMGEHLSPWDEAAVTNTIQVNLMGVIWAMKHQVAHMADNGGGTIVNTASIAGISGAVGTLDYTAAKHGVVGVSQAAALRYGHQGVRINVVCPGLIETAMTEAGIGTVPGADAAIKRLSPITSAMGEPNDIAEAVLWLSSARSKFVYGVALPVHGGFAIN
jgi:NAD(P)-dependent dehydrogenase (short-subunit alcohol dehydrogenase family)